MDDFGGGAGGPALCLAGGNALGAYQAGFCATLDQAGWRFPVIAATSIGAVNAALLISGGAAALTAFWEAARRETPPWPWAALPARRVTMLSTLLSGHPRLFRPTVPGLLSALAGVEVGRALFDRAPMRALLMRLVDFGRLNTGPTRLRLAAVSAESGRNLCFDTAEEALTLDHLMAATAFPLLFPPERIGAEWVVDAGVRRNLPLDLIPPGTGPCLALDLFPLSGRLPDTLTGIAARAEDLVMGGQAADAVDRFRDRAEAPPLVLAVPDLPVDRTATKTVDYSAAMLTARWQRGAADADTLRTGWEGVAAGGFWRLSGGRLTRETP